MDVTDLTEQEAFKAGFLAFCKEAGMSEADIEARVKEADWQEFFKALPSTAGHYFNQTWNPSTWGQSDGDPLTTVSRYGAGIGTTAAGAAAALASVPAWVGGSLLGLGTTAGAGLLGGMRRAAPDAGLSFAALPIAAGLGLGGAAGWGAAKLTEPNVRDEDLQAAEIEQAYRMQAKRLKARRDYEKYREARGL
jgi:hypothetical protein